ncbi:interferon-induced protein 44-like [Triplophysa dalaica]|uniref:interferon-induced protein 44-like n=1 Tax=Triplophysa dalaica TaxID=1582913 RepID=UPI0024DFD055|nr:interferon-induced protein 44-like [Triplophysa dalaica]
MVRSDRYTYFEDKSQISRIMKQKSTLKKQLEEFSANDPSVTDFKILVSGEVGTGKSSFINSVNNVFQDRITCGALVSSFAGTSFTKRVDISHSRAFASFTDFKTNEESHELKEDQIRSGKVTLHFVFRDIMGLERIPQVIVMTKVDEACQLVNKDLRKIYHSTGFL